jgi:hypothetical protein
VHPQPCAVSLVFVVSSGTPNNTIGMTASARHNKRRAFVCIRDIGFFFYMSNRNGRRKVD